MAEEDRLVTAKPSQEMQTNLAAREVWHGPDVESAIFLSEPNTPYTTNLRYVPS